MSAVFVVNPATGGGRGGRYWRRVEPLVRESFGRYRVRWTRASGHAAEIVREELERGARRLISVGGDGTLNELVEGFLSVEPAQREGAAVGCLPAGSGCDFARHFGIPNDPRQWVPRLAAAKARVIDAAEAEFEGFDGRRAVRRFVNLAALGLAGEVVRRTERSGKPLGGTASYLAAALAAVFSARPYALRFAVDGKLLEGGFHLAALANTSTTGGGMRMAPGADPADGLLDLVTVGPLTRGGLLRAFPKIYAGTHLGVPGVDHRRVRELSAESDRETLATLDGELVGRLPARFRVLPAVLPVLLGRCSD